VPMQLLGSVRIVVDLDRNRLPLLEAQQGSRELTVVGRRGEDVVTSELDEAGSNADRIVRALLGRARRAGLSGGAGRNRQTAGQRDEPTELEERPPIREVPPVR